MILQQEQPPGSSKKPVATLRRRRRSGQREVNGNGIYKAMLTLLNMDKKNKKRQIGGTVLFCSTILILMFLCIAHQFWLFLSTNNTHQKYLKRKIDTGWVHRLDSQTQRSRSKTDAIVQSQLESLHRNLFASNMVGGDQTAEQHHVHVNMMLMAVDQQQQQATVQQQQQPLRRRSPTPEPSTSSPLDFAVGQQQQQQFFDQNADADEPTLMDYDAIDAYWRWDIEQEKGTNAMQMVLQPQDPHEQQFYPYAPHQFQQQDIAVDANIRLAPAEEQLYERDIQLLTEKSLFPEMSHPATEFSGMPYAVNNNDNSNLYYDHVDPNYVMAANSSLLNNNKGWETLATTQQQWPTTSAQYAEQFDEGFEFDGLFAEADTFSGCPLMPSPSLPLCQKSVTPPPAPLSTASSHQSLEQPILFENVSLGLAASLSREETAQSDENSNEEYEMQNVNLSEAISHDLESIEQLMSNAALNDPHQNPMYYRQQQPQHQHPLPVHMPLFVQPFPNNNNTNYMAEQQQQQPTSSSMSSNTIRSCPSTASSGFGSSYGTVDESSSICLSPSLSTHQSRQWRVSQASSNGSSYAVSLHPSSFCFAGSSTGYRFENKLVPKKPTLANKMQRPLQRDDNIVAALQKPKSKRGRRSKDDSLVYMHDLPYTADQLTAMTYKEYKQLMSTPALSLEQKAMIKKIRRRGRNKLAARKCRTLRLGQVADDEEEEEYKIDVEENEEDNEFPKDVNVHEASSAAHWLERWANDDEETDEDDEVGTLKQENDDEEGESQWIEQDEADKAYNEFVGAAAADHMPSTSSAGYRYYLQQRHYLAAEEQQQQQQQQRRQHHHQHRMPLARRAIRVQV